MTERGFVLRMTIAAYVRVLGILGLISVSPESVTAREKPPEPIEKPGECPIDAPLRVANLDTLRHFEGLIGHCPDSAFVETTIRQTSHLRAMKVEANDSPQFIPAWKIPAETEQGAVDGKSKKERDQQTVAIASRDGSQVAIRPGVGAWNTGANQTATGAVAAMPQPSAETSEQEAAILALRPRSYATVFDETIANAARAHRVDPLLLHAVIKQESAYKPNATSHAGARGLMQVMPGTGRMLGVRNSQHLYNPNTNVNAGAKLLSQLWARFDGNIDLVLAAYNAGEGAVRKYGNAIPPYRETRNYVLKVKANYRKLAAESGLTVNF